eukprot:TRINITY_DN35409_c0_g1_i1.p1 TRINITY_DN35409_c0_g1~~TRINITY_DN35409_c0_g1_i1.p1  ORF type:complete len:700 (+),score=178.78 TRINITY_DN35409_c0_g1_i1:84-2102(+)
MPGRRSSQIVTRRGSTGDEPQLPGTPPAPPQTDQQGKQQPTYVTLLPLAGEKPTAAGGSYTVGGDAGAQASTPPPAPPALEPRTGNGYTARGPSPAAAQRPFTPRLHPAALGDAADCAMDDSAVEQMRVLGLAMHAEQATLDDPEEYNVFRITVFLWELISHTLQPVFLPITICVNGMNGVRNQMLIPSQGHPMQLAGWLLVAAAAIYFAVGGKVASSHLAYDFCLALSLWMYRQLVIATKYAFTPPSDYKRMKEVVNLQDTVRHLLYSWAVAGEEGVMQEVEFAERRAQVSLDPITLTFAVPQGDGMVTHVQAREYVREVARYSVHYQNKLVKILRNYVGWVVPPTLIAVLWLPLHGYPMWRDLSWTELAMKVLLSIFSILLGRALIIVMGAAVLHHWRSYLLMNAVLKSMTPTPWRKKKHALAPASPRAWFAGSFVGGSGLAPDAATQELHSADAASPSSDTTMARVGNDCRRCQLELKRASIAEVKLSMQTAENIFGWYVCRFVLLNTGRRFDTRASLFISYAMWILLALVIGTVSNIISGGSVTRHGALLTVGTQLIIALVVAADIFAAARCNAQQRVQSAILAQEELRIAQLLQDLKRSPGAEAVTETLRDALAAMAVVRRALKALASVSPVKVFGVAANFNMLTTFGSVCVSSIVVAGQLAFNSGF